MKNHTDRQLHQKERTQAAAGQDARDFCMRRPARSAAFIGPGTRCSGPRHAPSNAQLASPAIEKRVEALLKQMTLEEKLGQLVQYSDSGYDGQAQTAAEAAAAPGKNPSTKDKVDAMQLVSTGRLGSMLNTVGQARTNALQHAAVEKSRLHIPLMFGADIIHGYKTVYPIPLGLAATFDPELVTSLASHFGNGGEDGRSGLVLFADGGYFARSAMGKDAGGRG